MGGAMDLVSAGSRVMVVMEHTAKGKHKILKECGLPITGKGVVDVLITDLVHLCSHGTLIFLLTGRL